MFPELDPQGTGEGGGQPTSPAAAWSAAREETTAAIAESVGGGGTSGEPGSGGRAGNAESQGDSDPQGGNGAGGDAGAGTSTPETPSSGTGGNWWETEESRTAHEQELRDEADRRLRDQRRDLSTQFGSLQQQANERAALLTELEELERTNPAEFAQRIQTDARAAALMLEKAGAAGVSPIEQARGLVLVEQVGLLRSKLPDVVSAFEALPEAEQAKYTDPALSGGFYAWARDFGRREGAEGAVDTFKKSPEYREALRLAGEEAVSAAMRNNGAGSPPPADGAPPSTPTKLDTGNPWSDAAGESGQALRRTVDFTQVRGGRRTARSA